MRQFPAAALAAAALLALAACSSTTADPVASASPSASPSATMPNGTESPSVTASTSPSTSAAPNSAVERYCRGVDAFIAASRQALKDPTKADTEKLQQQASALAEQARGLLAELIANPELVSRVDECTQKLNRFTQSSPSSPES